MVPFSWATGKDSSVLLGAEEEPVSSKRIAEMRPREINRALGAHGGRAEDPRGQPLERTRTPLPHHLSALQPQENLHFPICKWKPKHHLPASAVLKLLWATEYSIARGAGHVAGPQV